MTRQEQIEIGRIAERIRQTTDVIMAIAYATKEGAVAKTFPQTLDESLDLIREEVERLKEHITCAKKALAPSSGSTDA